MSSTNEDPDERIQVTIVVHGRVQQERHRKKVVHAAKFLGLTGFVDSLPDSSVDSSRDETLLIACQGRRRLIKRFVELIHIHDSEIFVSRIDLVDQKDIQVPMLRFSSHRPTEKDEYDSWRDVATGILEALGGGLRIGNRELKELIDEMTSVQQERAGTAEIDGGRP